MESSLSGTVDLCKDRRAPCCVALTGIPHDSTKFEWNPPKNEDAPANVKAVSKQSGFRVKLHGMFRHLPAWRALHFPCLVLQRSSVGECVSLVHACCLSSVVAMPAAAGWPAQFTAHLNQHVLPKGVCAWPVQRVNWLKATFTCSNGDMIDIGRKSNRTGYILVLPEGLQALQELKANKVKVSSEHIVWVMCVARACQTGSAC